jgi:hypothetical protein
VWHVLRRFCDIRRWRQSGATAAEPENVPRVSRALPRLASPTKTMKNGPAFRVGLRRSSSPRDQRGHLQEVRLSGRQRQVRHPRPHPAHQGTGRRAARPEVPHAGQELLLRRSGREEPRASSGSWTWPAKGKNVTITEGELDRMMVSTRPSTTSGRGLPAERGLRKKAILQDFESCAAFDTIVLCFDGDEPGQKALKKSPASCCRSARSRS